MRALPLCEIFWLILAEATGAVRGGLSQRRRRGGNMFSNQLHSFRRRVPTERQKERLSTFSAREAVFGQKATPPVQYTSDILKRSSCFSRAQQHPLVPDSAASQLLV